MLGSHQLARHEDYESALLIMCHSLWVDFGTQDTGQPALLPEKPASTLLRADVTRSLLQFDIFPALCCVFI